MFFRSRTRCHWLNLIPQSTNVTSTITPATATTTHSFGWRIHHLPIRPETSSHGPATAEASANIVPPLFDWSDPTMLPRTKCAHEVVIPHDGQRKPTMTVNEHGLRPNCVCVPYPLGEGSRHMATVNRLINPIPNTTNNPRTYQCNFGPRGGVKLSDEASIAAQDKGGRLAGGPIENKPVAE